MWWMPPPSQTGDGPRTGEEVMFLWRLIILMLHNMVIKLRLSGNQAFAPAKAIADVVINHREGAIGQILPIKFWCCPWF